MIQDYSMRDYVRKWTNHIMIGLLWFLSILAAIPFFFIVYYVISRGISAINWEFFTQLPKPPGETGGGMSNAIIGSAIMVSLASIIGIPWGIGLGVYLNEYSHTKTAHFLRFIIDLLISVPTIIIGIFIYGLIVSRYGFSSYAGATTLVLVMLPLIARGTAEILKMIPTHIRETGLALGIPRYKVIISIIIPGSFSMLLTIIMLAIARIAGETAPLLFTALGNQFHIKNLNEPTSSLPVQIYEFSKSGFEQMETQAWAGAMVLVLFVFCINVCTRISLFFYKRRYS